MTNQYLHERLLQAGQAEKVQILFEYMKAHGQEHYEEDVTQMEHALQTAALAKAARKNEALITAALFHDIGHMLADDPVEANNPTLKNDLHEELAADYLQEIFPPEVTEPIRLHVPAKRYLCTIDAHYYEELSEASRKSFHLQGGRMSEAEITAFESHPHYREAIELRKWDDQAKALDLKVSNIESYASTVQKVIRTDDGT
jgi:phosphonate degradation associated HDIG domain protein